MFPTAWSPTVLNSDRHVVHIHACSTMVERLKPTWDDQRQTGMAGILAYCERMSGEPRQNHRYDTYCHAIYRFPRRQAKLRQRERPSKWHLQLGKLRKGSRKRATSRDVYRHRFSDENVTSLRERRWSSIGLRQSPLGYAFAASPHEKSNRIDSPDFTSKPLRSIQKLCPTGSRSSGVCGPKLPSGTHVLSRYLHWNKQISSAKSESMRSQALRASRWASSEERSSW
jgi:hypothetical protein